MHDLHRTAFCILNFVANFTANGTSEHNSYTNGSNNVPLPPRSDYKARQSKGLPHSVAGVNMPNNQPLSSSMEESHVETQDAINSQLRAQVLRAHGLRAKRSTKSSARLAARLNRSYQPSQSAMTAFAQTKLKTLAQGIGGVVWMLNARGRFLLWGGRDATTLNIKPEEREQRLIWDVYPANSEILDATRRALNGEDVTFRVELKGRIWEAFSYSLKDGQGRIVAVVGTAHEITERVHVEASLQHMALHDTLTGLANRTLFLERVSIAIEHAERRKGELFAVVLLDLDRFKVVNESLGYEQGNALLREVAKRLKNATRVGKATARLGGDEFALLLEDIEDPARITAFVKKIYGVFAEPFELDGIPFVCGVSMGIAVWEGTYRQPEALLRDAELAMYRAKAEGRGGYQFFGTEMHSDALRVLRMETDLRSAIENGALLLHYQPIIQLEHKRTMGFEALVRWQHPQRGLVSPAEFIPLAEETGLIVPLGAWVLREACMQMQQWRTSLPDAQHLSISVNVSSRQFAKADLVNEVKQALQASGLPPANLKLEITESVLMDNAESAIAMLRELSALGISTSIDDFGTGYSSLAMLARFPLHQLKIDRSFVQTLSAHSLNVEIRLKNGAANGYSGNHYGSAIVRTIINLADTLRLGTVAEGIETPEQLRILQDAGCTCGQGFLFSKPLNAEAIPAFLQSLPGGDCC